MAEEDADQTPSEETAEEDGEEIRKTSKRPYHKIPLPQEEDDPFRVIDRLDQKGGIDGLHDRMTPRAMYAFRQYCRMPALDRSIRRLHVHLAETGHKVAWRHLVHWSSRYDWQNLLKEYDSAIERWRLYRDELKREQAQDRHRRNGRNMQAYALRVVGRIVSGFEQDDTAMRAKATKIQAPGRKPTLAGLQGAAQLFKIGVEVERVALGLPTTITNQNIEGNINRTETVELTLEEWRRRTATERGTVAPSPHAPQVVEAGAGSGAQPLALPERIPHVPHVAHVAGAATLRDLPLTDEERAALPASWFDAETGTQPAGTKIDPLAAVGRRLIDEGPHEEIPDEIPDVVEADPA